MLFQAYITIIIIAGFYLTHIYPFIWLSKRRKKEKTLKINRIKYPLPTPDFTPKTVEKIKVKKAKTPLFVPKVLSLSEQAIKNRNLANGIEHYIFEVASKNTGEIYKCVAIDNGQRMAFACTCRAGRFKNICKHRINLCLGTEKNIISGEENLPYLFHMIAGTEIERLINLLKGTDKKEAYVGDKVIKSDLAIAFGNCASRPYNYNRNN